jgi:endonuclease/exonuclease/phosphatase family metal-dependent hydrolase
MDHMRTEALLMKRCLVGLAACLTVLVSATLLPAQAGAADLRARVTLTATQPTSFTLSSFNVLGFKHTEPGGKYASMEDGRTRIRWAVRVLERRSVDVVGMQELQMEQYVEFNAVAGDRFGIYPTEDLNRRNVQNSIAWRLDQWELVEGYSTLIPYFDGVEWEMPYVLLRNVHTGALAWFANFHNPATNKRHPGNRKWRAEATRREVALANRLLTETRHPVFITGDMNEREIYFCRMAGGAPMKAANGGRFRDGVCTPPKKPLSVNWMFGAKGFGKFTNYVRDDSPLVNKITDHIVVRSDVTIKAAPTG